MTKISFFNNNHKIPRVIWIIVLCFFIKTLILAFFITPLFDVPDETAHLSYIDDIAKGRGIPVLGTTLIAKEIITKHHPQAKEPPKVINFAAQHPPAYYIIGAIPLKIAELFTQDKYWLFRAPRIISSLSGAMALIIFYLIFKEVANSNLFSIAAVAAISFIPMFSHMSSGTNNDITLTLFSALAILYWFRLIKFKSYKDALLMSMWLSIASFTKITALAIALPILVISFFYINGKYIKRIGKWFLCGGISVTLPGCWMIRNFILFGNPLIDSTNFEKINNLINKVNILEFLRDQPVIEFTFRHFFGFISTGRGKLLMLQISEPYLLIYSIVLLILVIGSLVWYTKNSYQQIRRWDKYALIFSVIFLLSSYFLIFSDKNYPVYRQFLYPLLFATFPFLILSFENKIAKEDKLIIYSLWPILVFLISYILKLKEIYEIFGTLRATHGRYWFPLIPLLVIGFIFPFFKLLNLYITDKGNYKKTFFIIIFFIIILIISSMEIFFYTSEVIPFYLKLI